MMASILSLIILIGVAVKALVNRYWSAAAIALCIAYVMAGLLAHVLEARWPLIGELVARGPIAVLGVVIALPLLWCVVERRRQPKGSPKREVADLFGLVALVHAGMLVWTLAVA